MKKEFIKSIIMWLALVVIIAFTALVIVGYLIKLSN